MGVTKTQQGLAGNAFGRDAVCEDGFTQALPVEELEGVEILQDTCVELPFEEEESEEDVSDTGISLITEDEFDLVSAREVATDMDGGAWNWGGGLAYLLGLGGCASGRELGQEHALVRGTTVTIAVNPEPKVLVFGFANTAMENRVTELMQQSLFESQDLIYADQSHLFLFWSSSFYAVNPRIQNLSETMLMSPNHEIDKWRVPVLAEVKE